VQSKNIVKIIVTRCQSLRLKYSKFEFGWGCAPDPTGGDLKRSPDPIAGLKGGYFLGKAGNGSK